MTIAAEDQDQDDEVAEFVVESDIPPEIRSDASSTLEIIDVRRFFYEYKTLGDLLQSVAGVNVLSSGGAGKLQVISIRGSSSKQLTLLINGVRVTTSMGGDIDLSTIPLSSLERIEIIRGGASSLYGSGAMAGAINLVTRKGRERQKILSLKAGSFDTLESALSWTSAVEDWNLYLNLDHLQSRGEFKYRRLNGEEIRRTNNETLQDEFQLALDRVSGERKMGFFLEGLFSRNGIPGLGEFPSYEAEQKVLRNIGSVRYSSKVGAPFDGVITFEGSNLMRDIQFDDPDPYLGGPISTDSTIVSSSARLTFETLGDKHRDSLTIEVIRDALRDESFGNPDRNVLNLFLNEDFGIRKDTRLIFGGAYSQASGFGSEFAPKLGILHGPMRVSPITLSVRGNVSRSFRFPSFDELYFPEQGFVGGNPNLEAEKSTNYEIGLDFDTNKLSDPIPLKQSHPISGSLNLFLSLIDNSIIFVPVSPIRIEPINTGRAESKGFEIIFRTNLRPGLTLDGNYTYAKSRYIPSGVPLVGRPRQSLSAALDWKMGRHSSRVEISYDGRRTADILGNQTLGSKTLLNLSHTYRPDRRWSLNVRLNNILDQDARDFRDLPVPGRSVYITTSLMF